MCSLFLCLFSLVSKLPVSGFPLQILAQFYFLANRTVIMASYTNKPVLTASVVISREQLDIGYAAKTLAEQQDNEFCDIKLFGGRPADAGKSYTFKPIKGHKVTLASASPHLHKAFTVKGFIDSTATEYRITQIDHPTLQLIVNFVYTGKSIVNGTQENVIERVENVLIAADYLLMPELVRACGKALKTKMFLSSSNCVGKWLFARKYRCDVLEAAALRTVATDLVVLMKQQEFLNLSAKDVVSVVGELAKTVRATPVAYANAILHPDQLCDAAVAWLEFNKTVREEAGKSIMLAMPLEEMSAAGLDRSIRKLSFMGLSRADLLELVISMTKVLRVRDRMEKLEQSLLAMVGHVAGLEEIAGNRQRYYSTARDGLAAVQQRQEDKETAADLLAQKRPSL